MLTGEWIAISAAAVSVGTLAVSALTFRAKAAVDYVKQLETRIGLQDARIEKMEAANQACEARCAGLERQNLSLMRRLVANDVKNGS